MARAKKAMEVYRVTVEVRRVFDVDVLAASAEQATERGLALGGLVEVGAASADAVVAAEEQVTRVLALGTVAYTDGEEGP